MRVPTRRHDERIVRRISSRKNCILYRDDVNVEQRGASENESSTFQETDRVTRSRHSRRFMTFDEMCIIS